MTTIGQAALEAWRGTDEQLGRFVDALRHKHAGTFRTQGDVLALFRNVLENANVAPCDLPELRDLDARLFASEHDLLT